MPGTYPEPGVDIAKTFYAYNEQCYLGNVVGERPPIWDLINRVMYDAWKELEGMSQEDACTEFMEMAAPLLDDIGISYEDPEKAVIEAEYEACVQRLEEAGVS